MGSSETQCLPNGRLDGPYEFQYEYVSGDFESSYTTINATFWNGSLHGVHRYSDGGWKDYSMEFRFNGEWKGTLALASDLVVEVDQGTLKSATFLLIGCKIDFVSTGAGGYTFHCRGPAVMQRMKEISVDPWEFVPCTHRRQHLYELSDATGTVTRTPSGLHDALKNCLA